MRSLKDIGDAETERLERELKRAKAGDAAKVADLEAEISRLAAEVERLERLRRAAAEGETPRWPPSSRRWKHSRRRTKTPWANSSARSTR